jgi:phenylpropionate dioxygenase-like ring-hydroxylating dioxygenase large terminal subunit
VDDFNLVDGWWVVDPNATSIARGAKAPTIDYGPQIFPPKTYFDPELAVREREQFWPKTWTSAGRTQDVQNIGDYFTYELGSESFLIVRTSEQEVKAFFNVCPHRGNRIAHNDCGHVKKFTCSFHAWEFGLDGNLQKITDEELFDPKVIADRPGLKEIRCELWGGFVFINMNLEAEPLLQFLDCIPEHLAPYDLDNYRIFKEVEIEFNSNWKTAVDAFIEIYHVHSLHPELLAVAEEKKVQHDLFPNGHSRSIVPEGLVSHRVRDRPKDLNLALGSMLRQFNVDPNDYTGPADNVREFLIGAKRKWAAENGLDWSEIGDQQLNDLWSYFVFPNMTINILEPTLIIQRWIPHPTDPLKCRYVVQTLFPIVKDPTTPLLDITNQATENELVVFDPNERPERIRNPTINELGYVLNQDVEQLRQQQQGLMSRAFAGMRFSKQEARIPHYWAEMNRYLSGEKG